MMTAEEYKTALEALGIQHREAAKALGIGQTTSRRYAVKGAPKHIALALVALSLKFQGKSAA
jgi:ABC-type amino acid transport system permease subunit